MAKTATVIDRKLFEECVETVENRHEPRTLTELFELITEEYNATKDKEYKSLKWPTVRSRVIEWGIAIKTETGKGRGKRAVEVDKKIFLQCVEDAESNGARSNRNDLYAAVSELYNETENVPANITPSVVLLRIKEWGVKVKTPIGKRGREKEVEVFRGVYQDFLDLVDNFYDQRCPFTVMYRNDEVVVKAPASHSNVLETQTV